MAHEVHSKARPYGSVLIDYRECVPTFSGADIRGGSVGRNIANICRTDQLLRFAEISSALADDGDVRRNFTVPALALSWVLRQQMEVAPWVQELAALIA